MSGRGAFWKKELEKDKIRALALAGPAEYDGWIRISPKGLLDIHWWLFQQEICQIKIIGLIYFFPPFLLTGRILSRVLDARCRAVLALDWDTQPWKAQALQQAKMVMKFRRASRNLIPHGQPKNAEIFSKTPLMVCCF